MMTTTLTAVASTERLAIATRSTTSEAAASASTRAVTGLAPRRRPHPRRSSREPPRSHYRLVQGEAPLRFQPSTCAFGAPRAAVPQWRVWCGAQGRRTSVWNGLGDVHPCHVRVLRRRALRRLRGVVGPPRLGHLARGPRVRCVCGDDGAASGASREEEQRVPATVSSIGAGVTGRQREGARGLHRHADPRNGGRRREAVPRVRPHLGALSRARLSPRAPEPGCVCLAAGEGRVWGAVARWLSLAGKAIASSQTTPLVLLSPYAQAARRASSSTATCACSHRSLARAARSSATRRATAPCAPTARRAPRATSALARRSRALHVQGSPPKRWVSQR